MEGLILVARFIGFALCVGLYLLLIKHSRRNPGFVSYAFGVAMLGGLLLAGRY